MKKIIKFFVLFTLMLSVLPFGLKVKANGNYNGTVVMSNQYNSGSGSNPRDYDYSKSVNKEFTSATQVLGRGTEHEGSLNHLRTNFVGWTDIEPVNGELAPGAKVFTENDTVATAFPNGLTGGEKLYAVYFLFEFDQATLGFGSGFAEMRSYISKSNAYINKDTAADSVLPNTSLFNETTTDSGRLVIDTYAPKNDTTEKNEVVLTSQFDMDKKLALLVESNPYGQHWGLRILTSNYSNDMSYGIDSKDQNTGYTHVDMKVKVADGINVPSSFYLNFKAHSYRPIFVLDKDGNPLEIKNPTTGQSLGKTSSAFDTLVSNTSKNVNFEVVNTPGNNEFTVRVILRTVFDSATNAKYKITTLNDGEASIGESVVSTMELTSLAKDEINSKLGLNLSDSELNSKIFTVSDAKAKELAESDPKQTLKVSGNVEVHTKVYAGTVDFNLGFMTLPINLGGSFTNNIEAKSLEISYDEEVQTHNKYIKIFPDGSQKLHPDGKGIFNLGNKFEDGFKNLKYSVYSDSAKTNELTTSTPVTWKLEPIAGFETALVPSLYAGTLGDSTTYQPGVENFTKATAIKSGVYKVTATLDNGEFDYAYVVVPGDMDRNAVIDDVDSDEISGYMIGVTAFSIDDIFTLILADLDFNDVIDDSDVDIVNSMFINLVTSN